MQSALPVLLLSTLLACCWARGTSVHVVFGNHLAAVAKQMKALSPHGDRYVYTTHSYLISLFLDCPLGMGLNCPNSTTTAAVLDAIKSRAITWHAHPHNAQYEFYDRSLLEFSFDLTHDLDRRFGFPPKHTAILRDVPGLTRAAIPIFVSKGIKAISVGVNAGSAPPGLPRYTPFIWRDKASDTQILAFWHPGGYGGMRGDLALDPSEECIQAPGLKHVLCTSWRNDNSGPPDTVLEPLQIFNLLRQDWAPPTDSNPARTSSSSSSADTNADSVTGAHVFASSFYTFVDEVLAVLPSLNLPVVTDEIGDTWVFGVQSDSLKTANFRAASRLRAACIADPACPSETPEFYNFSRLLLKVPEHTWGVDIKKTLHDFQDYSNTRLHACLPPHLRPHWAPGYHTSGNSGSRQPGSSSDGSRSSSGSRGGVKHHDRGHNSATSSSDVKKRQGGSEDTHGGGSGNGGTMQVDADSKAPCPNYGHCIKAWNRQAAYVYWALQALPQDHWVVQAYAADLQARQQLAAVTPQQLMHSDTALLPWPQQPPQLQPQLPTQAHTFPGHGQSQVMERLRSECGTELDNPAIGVAKQRRLQLWQQQQLARISENTRTEGIALPTTQKKPAQPPSASSTPGSSAPEDSIADSTLDSTGTTHARAAPGSQSAQVHTREVAVTGTATHQSRCGSWRFELDEALGGLTSLVKYHGNGSTAGIDWVGGSRKSSSSNGRHAGVLCQLVYSAYCEASYDDVWEHYAWHKPLPWWFPLDFGKVNSSHAWDHEEHVTAKLIGIFETSTSHGLQQLSLKYSLPHRLVREVGAPETLWTIISCPAPNAAISSRSSSIPGISSSHDGDVLHVSVMWQDKTPTRIPEALWFSFRPAHSAVDADSWRLHKLGSSIHPHEVMLNGSQSMHAVSDEAVSVASAAGNEVLQIKTWDTALVSPGHPTPFPQGLKQPDLKQGVHFNLANNIWGTNYIMWIPYSTEDRNLAFRFTLQAHRESTA